MHTPGRAIRRPGERSMQDQRNLGRWVGFSPALLLLSVGCGDLGAGPTSNGLESSYGGSAGSYGGSAGSAGSGSVSCPSSISPGSVKAVLGANCTGCHGTQLLAGA